MYIIKHKLTDNSTDCLIKRSSALFHYSNVGKKIHLGRIIQEQQKISMQTVDLESHTPLILFIFQMFLFFLLKMSKYQFL